MSLAFFYDLSKMFIVTQNLSKTINLSLDKLYYFETTETLYERYVIIQSNLGLTSCFTKYVNKYIAKREKINNFPTLSDN